MQYHKINLYLLKHGVIVWFHLTEGRKKMNQHNFNSRCESLPLGVVTLGLYENEKKQIVKARAEGKTDKEFKELMALLIKK